MPPAQPSNSPTSSNGSTGNGSPQRTLRERWRAMSAPKRTFIILVVLAVVVVGGAAGVMYYRYAESHISTDDAFLAAHIVPISARVAGHVAGVNVHENQPVHQGDVLVQLDRSDFEATLNASQAQLESANHALAVAELAVHRTSQQTDAQIAQARASVDQALAAERSAQSMVEQSAQKVTQAEAEAATARAQLAQAQAQAAAKKADADRDSDTLRRTQEAFKTGAATQLEVDDARFAATASAADAEASLQTIAVAESMVNEATTNIEVARSQQSAMTASHTQTSAAVVEANARLDEARIGAVAVQIAQTQVRQAQSNVQQWQAMVQRDQLNLTYTTITAPRDGRVTTKSVEVGQNVAIGQSLLAIVSADVWIEANYKETDLAGIAPGLEVEIEVDAYPGVTFAGRVDSVQSGTGSAFSLLPAQNATGNYVKVVQRVPVKIVFDPLPDTAKYVLAPGMSVVPTVLVHSEKRIPRAPDETTTASTSDAP